MKISNKQLQNILREAIAECGEPMPQTHDHHEDQQSLGAVVDMLSKNVEPMKVGHGGKAKMARGHLYHISNRSQSLYDRLADDDELPEWVQSKLAVAESMVNAVYDHLDYKLHNYNQVDHDESITEVQSIVRSALNEVEGLTPMFNMTTGEIEMPEVEVEVDEDEDGRPDHDIASGASSGTHSTHTTPSEEDDLWDRLKARFTPSDETTARLKQAGKGLAVVGGATAGAAVVNHAQKKQRKNARKEYGK